MISFDCSKSMTAIKNFLLNNFGIIDLSIINFIMTPSVFIRKDVYKVWMFW